VLVEQTGVAADGAVYAVCLLEQRRADAGPVAGRCRRGRVGTAGSIVTTRGRRGAYRPAATRGDAAAVRAAGGADDAARARHAADDSAAAAEAAGRGFEPEVTREAGEAVIATRILLLLAVWAGACAARAQMYDKPLGAALEEYPYPWPVQFLPLDIEGQPVRMAYMDVPPAGQPNGSAIVLLHGKNFYGGYWEETARALASRGFRVVIPDQVGFGKSSKPAIAYSFDLLAANTLKLLDHLKIDRAAVVGHSMGGMLAVRFARNYPDRTTHLVLENPIGLEDYRFKVPPRETRATYEEELRNTDPEKIRAFLKRYFVEWKPERYERFVEVRTRVTLGGEYPRWAMASALTYQMIYQQPVRHEFGLIRVPTLLVIGQSDRTTIGRGQVGEDVIKTMGQYPQLGKDAARDIPGSKLIEFDNVGHLPHLEAPERFHQELVGFLKP
jgi:pimeloyl-ACP methyl ester carboxylesterase